VGRTAIFGKLERAKGIEPSYAAWEAAVLPLNYARELYKIAHSLLAQNCLGSFFELTFLRGRFTSTRRQIRCRGATARVQEDSNPMASLARNYSLLS
jgi:hypothetical protein